MYEQYKQYLSTLEAAGKYRRLGGLRQDNKDSLDFSTNDYLCLSQNNLVIEAAINAVRDRGVGSTGSRLLSGNSILLEELERRVALDKKTEASLIFNSGFQANFSALSSLLDSQILKARPIVFFDRLNHASLYQAVFLSKAELCRYNHLDIYHLESLLKSYENDPRPKFIVTETVFGMDGDVAPLKQIVELASLHKAFLYLDEAHATGLFGKSGYGLSTSLNLNKISHAIMGTFSKALGSAGGYVACNRTICDYLMNKSSGFIYSTAPSPAVVGAAFKAWEMVEDLDKERAKLQNLGEFARKRLKKSGFDTGTSTTHIIPIILGDERLCLSAKQELLKDKIIVSAIRPPTIPPKTSRIRIALTISHTEQDVERLIASVRKRIL